MHRHDANAVDSLFHDRCIADVPALSLFIKPVDKRPERDQSIALRPARHVRQTHDVGECLLTSGPVGKSGMSARKCQQCSDGVGNRTAIPPAMKVPQDPKCFSNVDQRLG